tara:strand:- start:39 stop:770 length:732 start_codon:yes stop_codon:yes gene_type:complete
MSENSHFTKISNEWIKNAQSYNYSHHFHFLGRPIIQYPQDIIAIQELIWNVKPDLIIETGIAHGGSLIMSASMLALIDICEAINKNENINPKNSTRRVVGIDIEIRSENRKLIEKHPMYSRIEMIEGSSIDKKIIDKVHEISKNFKNIMIFLDSNHTYDHVLEELNAYAKLTTVNSYCVVFDTFVNDLPEELSIKRPWGPTNNPRLAVLKYLKTHPEFMIDKKITDKLQISVSPDGYLKRIEN